MLRRLSVSLVGLAVGLGPGGDGFVISRVAAAAPAVSSVGHPDPGLMANIALADQTGGGNQMVLNGRAVAVPWRQRGAQIGLSDYGVMHYLGLELLNSDRVDQQPVRWFSDPSTTAFPLATWIDSGSRFVDITPLAQHYGWQLAPTGVSLNLTLPNQQVTAIRSGQQPWGDRLVVDLTGAAAWRLEETGGELALVISAGAVGANLPGAASSSGRFYQALRVEAGASTTILRATLDSTVRPQVTSLPNPNRLVIDLRQDNLIPRTIHWAQGLDWHQDYVSVNGKSFPVYWLAADLGQTGLSLRPIWADPATAVGITPLITMAQRWQAAAAINGGFFNRNNQYPLGAVRRDGDWISGPILGRGVFAWNDQGQTQFDRMALSQTLTTAAGSQFAIKALNSGYVQAGIGLYTPAWGATYRSIVDNEILVTVVANQVVAQQPTGASGQTTVAIPTDGYMLAVRSDTTAVRALAPGQTVTIASQITPASLEGFPNIIGGGPLLLKQQSVVLSAESEQFSAAFASQAALRSAVGRTTSGQILLVAVHQQPGGRGPTLAELAQVMLKLGCTDAVNLDGGSSSSLYLGGQLLNRPASTAARVQNGLGLFIDPP